MLATCRQHGVMSANFSKKGMSPQQARPKKRPRHTVFVCRVADTIQNSSMPPQPTGKEDYPAPVIHGPTTRGNGGGGSGGIGVYVFLGGGGGRRMAIFIAPIEK